MFVATCTIGFCLVEGMEFANAFTYGGNYLSSFPFTIFGTFIRRFFTFLVPGRLRRLPADARAARSLRPARAAQLALVVHVRRVSLLAAAAAGCVWRPGLRHYVGAGS